MHEIHLMTRVVKMVEAQLQEFAGARPAVVRLKVSTLSHLHDHDMPSIGTVFDLAARGTAVEGAALEVIPVPVGAWCEACGMHCNMDGSTLTCPTCRAGTLLIEDVPEVVLHEIVIE